MSTTTPLLRRIEPGNVRRYVRDTLDPNAVQDAQAIINDVRSGGIEAVRSQAERFGELKPGQQLVLNRDQLQQAIELVDSDSLELLRRVSQRIERFASAQRESIRELSLPIPGGEAGHSVLPVDSAGCYAPAGRHPLPSSVLMTAMTARVAGCKRVVVASPSSDPVMLAAAAIAGADEFLAVGGAHAVAALAFGFEGFASCDVIVGPGNKWVTAAKHLVSDRVGIDMLAGPSELLILADESANPRVVAADLLAQAEHDDDAVPMLVTTSTELPNL
ncbi:MAG: histidinol dehydrogenase, partial [Phycisphaerales bacterium JB058]